MLSFFPTPYIDEWWYSVVSRYYVHSGIPAQNCALDSLYDGKLVKHGQEIPSRGFNSIIEKLPKDFMSAKDIVLNHTMVPFYFRLESSEEKQAIINRYTNGTGYRITKFDVQREGNCAPRYCPKCYYDDIQKYGEPYWHREHQIALNSVCSIHNCRLVQAEVNWPIQMNRFFPLACVSPQEANYCVKPYETAIAKVIKEYIEYPYEYGPSTEYSNLSWVLVSAGFGAPTFLKKAALDPMLLYKACVNYYGEELTEKYFCKTDSHTFYRTVNCVYRSPERFVLLQVLSGASTAEIFGPNMCLRKDIWMELEKKRKSGKHYTAKQLQAELNINNGQLELIADAYEVPRFWGEKYGKGPHIRTAQLNLMLTPEEKELIRQKAKETGKQTSVFAREILMKSIKR